MVAECWLLFDLYLQELQYESLQTKQQKTKAQFSDIVVYDNLIHRCIFIAGENGKRKKSDLQKGSPRASTSTGRKE